MLVPWRVSPKGGAPASLRDTGWLQNPFNEGLIARGQKLGPGGGMGPAR